MKWVWCDQVFGWKKRILILRKSLEKDLHLQLVARTDRRERWRSCSPFSAEVTFNNYILEKCFSLLSLNLDPHASTTLKFKILKFDPSRPPQKKLDWHVELEVRKIFWRFFKTVFLERELCYMYQANLLCNFCGNMAGCKQDDGTTR